MSAVLIWETINQINQIKSNQMLVFEERGKPEFPGKTSRSGVENQQSQPTYDAGSGNQTRDTLVEGERSRHCANPAAQPCLCTCFIKVPCHKNTGRN